MKKNFKLWLIVILCLLVLPMFFSARVVIPVEEAVFNDWNKNSFWYYPWGKSGVHKGIDIFAPEGRNVLSAAKGIVLFSGENKMGGNVVAILGAKWRIYYYAHLQSFQVSPGQWVKQGEKLGLVGTSGNAAGKPPHLHFSVATLLPYPWNWDNSPQGWKKMFYLNPDRLLWKSFGKTEINLKR